MSQNDWNFSTYYLNGTPAEGASELHSNRPNLIPEHANAGTYCRRWRFYETSWTNRWIGCFISSKKPELREIPDTKAVSIRAWMSYEDNRNRDNRLGLIARGRSETWDISGGSYAFSYVPYNNTFYLDGTNYVAPSGFSAAETEWVHLRMDLIPIKLNGVTIMDNLRGFVEIDGEWTLVAEKFIETTDNDYISPTSGKYYGVYHHYYAYYSYSNFYVDKIKIHTESLEQPDIVSIELTNDTGVSSTDKITNDSSISVVSSVESGSVVQYSTNSYNWQDTAPAFVAGNNTVYARQVGANGSTSTPSRLDFLYAPEGPEFSSEATSSVYQGAGSDFLIYKTEASSVTDFSYDLKQVDDYADFSISSSSGLVYANNNLDYTTKNSYNFTVTATDLAGNTTEKPVLLNVLEEDEHYYDTSLILKMDNDLSCSSAYEQDVTVSGVQLTGSTSKYGGSSAYFDGGTNTGLQIPSSGLLDLRNIDWTMEAWINPDGDYSDHRKIIAKRNYSGTYDYQIYLEITNGQLAFWNGTTGFGSGVTPPANQWTHIAAVRKDGVVTLYINGEAKASQTLNIVNHNNVPLGIGNVGDLNRHPFRGYIDDVRITKGVARYTEDFAPPGPVPSSGGEAITASNITEGLFMNIDPSLSASYPGSGSYIYDTVNNVQGSMNGVSVVSGSMVFNGNNGLVNLGSSMTLSTFSISVAVKPNSTQTVHAAIFDNDYDSSYNFSFRRDSGTGNDNQYRFSARNSSDSEMVYVEPSQWNIITISFTNDSGIMIYKNGELVSTQHAEGISVGSQYLRLGYSSYGYYWNGEMGFFKIYNKPLSLVEVKQDYEANKAKYGLS